MRTIPLFQINVFKLFLAEQLFLESSSTYLKKLEYHYLLPQPFWTPYSIPLTNSNQSTNTKEQSQRSKRKMGNCLSVPTSSRRNAASRQMRRQNIVYPSRPTNVELAPYHINFIVTYAQSDEDYHEVVDWDKIVFAFQFRWGFSISRREARRAYRDWRREWGVESRY